MLEETLPGCLVRVSMGVNVDQQVTYLVSPVLDILTGERYECAATPLPPPLAASNHIEILESV